MASLLTGYIPQRKVPSASSSGKQVNFVQLSRLDLYHIADKVSTSVDAGEMITPARIEAWANSLVQNPL